MDSMENLRDRIAKWLYLDGRPFHMIESPNFKAMMVPLVKDYTTMSRDTFNERIDFEINRFRERISKLANEASQHMYGEKFMHLIHDMWTGADGNNYLGFSCSFIWEMELIKVKLGLVKNNVSHEAKYNAVLLEHSLLKQYKFDFSQWCRSVVSDTTNCALNVGQEFSKDSDQVYCEMHELNSCLKYGYGLLENKRTKFARNEDGTFAVDKEGQRYKVTSITTPGGEFRDGNRIFQSLQNIAKYFGTAQRMERLKVTQSYLNCPEGKPAYSGDTRVSSVHKLFSTSLFHYFSMQRFAAANSETDTSDHDFFSIWKTLSIEDWKKIQEMEAVTVYIAKYASCESQMAYITSSFTEYLRIKA